MILSTLASEYEANAIAARNTARKLKSKPQQKIHYAIANAWWDAATMLRRAMKREEHEE